MLALTVFTINVNKGRESHDFLCDSFQVDDFGDMRVFFSNGMIRMNKDSYTEFIVYPHSAGKTDVLYPNNPGRMGKYPPAIQDELDSIPPHYEDELAKLG